MMAGIVVKLVGTWLTGLILLKLTKRTSRGGETGLKLDESLRSGFTLIDEQIQLQRWYQAVDEPAPSPPDRLRVWLPFLHDWASPLGAEAGARSCAVIPHATMR
jgi:hypothetical protein